MKQNHRLLHIHGQKQTDLALDFLIMLVLYFLDLYIVIMFTHVICIQYVMFSKMYALFLPKRLHRAFLLLFVSVIINMYI